MARVLVRVDRETERYLGFSTISGGFTWFAQTREEAEEYLFDEDDRKPERIREHDDTHPKRRLERADKRGSDSYIGRFFWDDEEGEIYKNDGFLHRCDLPEIFIRMKASAEAHPDAEEYPDPDLSDLLTPIED